MQPTVNAIALSLLLFLAAINAGAAEPVHVSYREASAAFKKFSEEANTMGMIQYCGFQEKFPTVEKIIANKIVDSFEDDTPKEDRQVRNALLLSMINMYAGGVAHGLSIFHTVDRPTQVPDMHFCAVAMETAQKIFPMQETKP